MSATRSYADSIAKRRREVVTPEAVLLPFTVASRAARAGALLLDFTILYVGMTIFTLLLIWTGISLVGDAANEVANGPVEFLIVAFFVVLFLARYGYFMWFELGPRGATPGKRAAGMRVAARDGGRLTPEAVLARNLLRDIELFLPLVFIAGAPEGEGGAAGVAAALWFLVFMLFPFFNRDALRAGDLIAGTWVVEAPRGRLEDLLVTREATETGRSALTKAEYRFGEEELAVYGERELQALERVLRDGSDDALVAVHGAICTKLGWNPGAGDERAFLEAFYAQLRARLEGGMRFGKRKADKYSA